ncbi:MAG: SpoVG family protein [Lachnospira sp.]|nr:SpoVG family protein [Lachnospira sp.]
MDVTDIRLNMINKEGGCKAIGSFSLDGAFAIRGVRVMEDKNGRNFVAFPSRAKSNGEYEDIAFPLSKDFYHKITDAICEEYQKMKDEQ